jgi:hypothetical protein
MKASKISIVCLLALLVISSGCQSVNLVPIVKFSNFGPQIPADLTKFEGKRALLLPAMEPSTEPGIGKYFGSMLLNQLLQYSSFSHISYGDDLSWYGMQSGRAESFSTGAALAAEQGADFVILAEVERFVYSNNNESSVTANFWIIESATGEMVHSQRIIARGIAGTFPPFWNPNLNKPVAKDDLFMLLANEIVLRFNGKEAVDEESEDDRELF